MFAAVRGTRLYFDIDGAGLVPDGATMRERPVAMLVHGGPGGDHSGFKPAMGHLAERMQLVYFDHRGQGRSDPADPASYTLDENVEDMEALRRHLGLGPVVSIGTSYGGMVAMAHAARYPDAVSHLVLIATAAHGGFIAQAQQIVAERGTRDAAPRVRDTVERRVPHGWRDAAATTRSWGHCMPDGTTRRRRRRGGIARSTRRSRSTGRSGRPGSCAASTCGTNWRASPRRR